MTRLHRLAAAAIVLAVPLVLGACSDDGDGGSAATSQDSSTTSSAAVNTGPTVEIVGLSFAPATETVTVGETVTWSNNGDSVHTVTPDELADGSVPWTSTQLEPGQTFLQTFNTPGTYDYFCSIHPDRMTGTVTVEAAS